MTDRGDTVATVASRRRRSSVVTRVRARLRQAVRPLETTAAGMDRGMALVFLGLRLVSVMQLVVALALTVGRSPRPGLDVALAVAFVAESAAVLTVAFRRGGLRIPTLARWDTATGTALLLGMVAVTDPHLRVNTWDAWGYAATISCAVLAGVALPTRPQVAVAAGALTAAYLAATVPTASDPTQSWSALVNALAFPAFAVLARETGRYLMRLARAADTTHALVAQRAAQDERIRAHTLLHDKATILRLVAEDISDPALRAALRAQASIAANEITAYISDPPACAAPGPADDLADLARSVAASFADLAPTVSVDFATGTRLSPDAAEVVRSALTTVLHNVRAHARATWCVVHADVGPDGWEVSVSDDGVGFDQGSTALGFGLSRQVLAACRGVGVEALIRSAPGEGASVVLRGRSDPTPKVAPHEPGEPRVTRSQADAP